MAMKTLLSCLLLGVLPGTICVAQEEPPIKIPSLTYTVILPDFLVGAAIDVHLDPQSIENAGGTDSLQARIIRGSMRDLKTKVRFLTRDGCLFYRSHIYSLGRSAIGVKVLTAEGGPDLTLTPGWLSHDPDTVGANQSFVMIIEEKGAANDILKIRPQDAPRYFDTGLEFIVKSNRRLQPKEERELIQRGQEGLAATTAAAEATRTGGAAGGPTPGHGRCLTFSRISTGTAFLTTGPCPVEIARLSPPPKSFLADPVGADQ